MFKTKQSNRIASRRNLRRESRRGAAVVEAALCIPLVVMLMLGTLEVCSGIYLKESLTVAAFEGVRSGVGRRTTRDDVAASVDQMLKDRNVVLGQSGEILIEPEDFSTLKALDPISVTITAPTAGNSLYIFDSLVNRNVRARVIMVREFDD